MIIFQFDDVYHKWGLLVVQSLQLHESHTRVLCDTVNLTDRQITVHEAHARIIALNDTTTWNETSPTRMVARNHLQFRKVRQRFSDQPWFAGRGRFTAGMGVARLERRLGDRGHRHRGRGGVF
jgi:hypothetical protein